MPWMEYFGIRACLPAQEDANKLSPSRYVINDFSILARCLPSPGKSELAMVLTENAYIEMSVLEYYEQSETAVLHKDVLHFLTN